MTTEQLECEIRYQASISPFRRMIEKGIISTEDYAIIDTILSRKYRPIFVGCLSKNGVAISENQR